MPRNGNRPGERAVHSVGELSKNAAESSRHPATTQAPSARRPTFVLELEARPGGAGIRQLRWLIKQLARGYGLRVVKLREAENVPTGHISRGRK
jgi:hypothetical protein